MYRAFRNIVVGVLLVALARLTFNTEGLKPVFAEPRSEALPPEHRSVSYYVRLSGTALLSFLTPTAYAAQATPPPHSSLWSYLGEFFSRLWYSVFAPPAAVSADAAAALPIPDTSLATSTSFVTKDELDASLAALQIQLTQQLNAGKTAALSTPKNSSTVSSLTAAAATASQVQSLLAQVADLRRQIAALSSNSIPANIQSQLDSLRQMISLSNRINQLQSVTIANPSFTGTVTGITQGTTFDGNLSSILTVTATATSTFAGGINITGGCFALNGTCITGGGGGSLSGFTHDFSSDGNTAVGVDALTALTTGSHNSAFGNQAGIYTTTGSRNSFFGSASGYYNTSGSSNTFSGYYAGFYNTAGAFNTFSGTYAGRRNTTGSNNLFVGYESGDNNTTGGSNVFIGDHAGFSNTVGSSTIAIGANAGYSYSGTYGQNIFIGNNAGYNADASTWYLTFLGYGAGLYDTSGHANTYAGSYAGALTTSGSYNTFYGAQAGINVTTGSYNTFSGYNAGNAAGGAGSGSYNTFTGLFAGYHNIVGSNNLFEGANSGYNNTTGGSNVFLGDHAGYSNTTGSSTVAVGTDALWSLTDGFGNSAVGYQALYTTTSGYHNSAFGYKALQNSLATQNSAFGYEALKSDTAGADNSAFGTWSLLSNTIGSNNTGSGYYSLFANTTGVGNTAVGTYSLYNNHSGSNNVAVGYLSLVGQNVFGTVTSVSDNGSGGTTLHTSTGGFSNGDSVTIYSYGDPQYDGVFTILNAVPGVSFDINTPYVGNASGLAWLIGKMTGSRNIGFGYNSGRALLDGSDNTFSGYKAGAQTKSGNKNQFFGSWSGYNNATGTSNIFVGDHAGFSNTTGSTNVFLGDHAGYSNTTASSTIAIGANAGYSFNGTKDGNIFIGYNAGYNATPSDGSLTFIGYVAGAANTTGIGNTFSGYYSGSRNTTGSNNVFYGGSSGSLNTTGNDNTASGYTALTGNVAGSFNVAFGYSAGSSITNGSANSFFGTFAGENGTTDVSTSTAIGYNAQVSTSSAMILGASSGQGIVWIGSGTTSPAAKFSLQQTADTPQGGIYLSSVGNNSRAIYMTSTGTLAFYGGLNGTHNTASLTANGQWLSASDQAFKENIVDLNSKYNLDTVLSLEPRYYTMKGTGEPQIGFVAQEMQALVPEVVAGENGSLGITYGNLVALSIQGEKDLAAILNIQPTASTSPLSFSSLRLDSIDARIAALEARSQGFSTVIQAAADFVGNSVRAASAVFERLSAQVGDFGTVKIKKGIEMKDTKTGTLYCLTIANGEWNKEPGACQDQAPSAASGAVTITLQGNNPAQIFVGDVYADLGATAEDSLGNSLMPDMATSTVDTSKPGTYMVIWQAHDSQMNQATASRTVVVSLRGSVASSTVSTSTDALPAMGSATTTDQIAPSASTTPALPPVELDLSAASTSENELGSNATSSATTTKAR